MANHNFIEPTPYAGAPTEPLPRPCPPVQSTPERTEVARTRIRQREPISEADVAQTEENIWNLAAISEAYFAYQSKHSPREEAITRHRRHPDSWLTRAQRAGGSLVCGEYIPGGRWMPGQGKKARKTP